MRKLMCQKGTTLRPTASKSFSTHLQDIPFTALLWVTMVEMVEMLEVVLFLFLGLKGKSCFLLPTKQFKDNMLATIWQGLGASPPVIKCFEYYRGLECTETTNKCFPASFKFGAATSSYQIEGAWNECGKGEGFWDSLLHARNDVVIDGSNGDVACDSYHKYKEDIAALKALKVDHYKFSISWSRILPTGFVNKINQDGVDYYNNLIDALLEAGIEPWVTMWHFDFPQTITMLGAWNHPDTANYMTDLADLLFSLYGDRVKTWLTLNEPVLCAIFPSLFAQLGFKHPLGVTEYMCGHNILRAHAKIYRLYERKYKKKQGGRLSIPLNFEFSIPGTNCPADIKAAERRRLFDFGWFAYPLVYGNYPQVMIDTIGNNSAVQGYSFSRLPEFTLEEQLELKGAYDFIAISHFGCNLVKDARPEKGSASYFTDDGVRIYRNASWGNTSLEWVKIYPEGFRQMLVYVKDTYCNPEIVITGSGFVDDTGTLNDTDRIDYIRSYLSEAWRAINEDGVKLTGYTVWSLLDSFEFLNGYTAKFGLYNVDFNDPERPRTAKDSAAYYRNVIESKCCVD